jgi:hypothetical protein
MNKTEDEEIRGGMVVVTYVVLSTFLVIGIIIGVVINTIIGG